jgi:hypothetical protein
MTIFSSTASPGRRWKMFLPGAASINSHAGLSTGTARALIRNRWLSHDTPWLCNTSQPAGRLHGAGGGRRSLA